MTSNTNSIQLKQQDVLNQKPLKSPKAGNEQMNDSQGLRPYHRWYALTGQQ